MSVKKCKIIPASVVSLSAEVEEQVGDEHNFDHIIEDFIVGKECNSDNIQEISMIAEIAFREKYGKKKVNTITINHIGPLDTFHLVG